MFQSQAHDLLEPALEVPLPCGKPLVLSREGSASEKALWDVRFGDRHRWGSEKPSSTCVHSFTDLLNPWGTEDRYGLDVSCHWLVV